MADFQGSLVHSEEQLEPLKERWRALADAAGNPFMGPDWTLAWWRHAAPAGARLDVGVVTEGSRLVGLAPCYVSGRGPLRRRLRMLGAGSGQALEPLAVPGRERDVAKALATAGLLATAPGARLELEWVPVGSPWPPALAEGWRALAPSLLLEHPATSNPVIDLTGGDFDEWLAARRRKYRKELRRTDRRLLETGAKIGQIGLDDVPQTIEALIRLNRARWESRGLPPTIKAPLQKVLRAEAQALFASGILAFWALRREEEFLAVEATLSAGSRVSLWQGGFDPAWGRHSPSIALIVALLRAAFEEGMEELDLGPGPQVYKDPLATGYHPVRHVTVAPRGAGYSLTWAMLAPRRVRDAVARRLTADQRGRLKGALRR